MWESRYCSRRYGEGRKVEPVGVSRSTRYGSRRKDGAYKSTFGIWDDDFGSRLWDDVRSLRCPRGNGTGRRITVAQRRSVIRQPVAREVTPRRHFRFDLLAAPKKHGQCGPRCKTPRCAAIEHEQKLYCNAADHHERKERKDERYFDARNSTGSTVRNNTYITTMANFHVIHDRVSNTENHDSTTGLRNLKKVNKVARELEDFPIDEQNCERNCDECSNAAQKLTEAMTYINPESGTELRSSTITRTMGTNTERFREKVDYGIPARVLKEKNNNIISEELPQKATTPIPRVKIPTPIPRVALLKPPKHKAYTNLNNLAIKSELQLRTPQPKPWNSSPQSLTSRRTTPRRESHPQTQKLMGPGKLAPRLFTPPTFTLTHTPRSISTTKQDQDPQQNQPEPTELEPPKPIQPLNLREALNQGSSESSRKFSEEASRGYSLVTTTSESDSSSEEASIENSNKDSSVETPSMYCVCSLCGKSETVNDGFRMNSAGAAVYRNNPLYSPPESMTSGASWTPVSTVSWRLVYTLLEVLVLVMLGGALTLGLIPYVDSVFRAYMVDFCRSSGTNGGTGPELTADGMQSGVVKWVTCMMDDIRTTLTPVR
ncbi:hypothetical protein KC19_VG291600 [Ceratodon purpureus]|uniref:Uncharacterized protein n=1 Tax=Ceratodon purpureus TaxID=3225 RepID=A0A8T0HVQ9_CERPU|nr:hypothetical protein KC19_VG291600 [Ceratodon purpureus]